MRASSLFLRRGVDMNVFILRDLPGGPVGSTQVDAFDK